MVAKWVADAASHSLYHAMLDTKCVPFLPPEPASRFSLDLLPVTRVMRSPVVCMKPKMTVRGRWGAAAWSAAVRKGLQGCTVLLVKIVCP